MNVEVLELSREEYEAISGFLDGLKPDPIMTVSEWADQFRYLAPEASSEHGKFRTSRTPYLKEIMDKLSVLDPTRKIVFMKGSQIGATEAANNWIGYIIDMAPGPSMMVMPTDEMARRNSKLRIDTMVKYSERLRNKIAPAKSRDAQNNTLNKSFPNGVLIMTGANSPSALSSTAIKNMLLDETDRYPSDVGGEGSPIELAETRTNTFPKRKILAISTPVLEGTSIIDKEFKKTDQRHYHVACPHCGTYQDLKFERLQWTAGEPADAAYCCADCGVLIEERHKTVMLAGGLWVAHAPENASVELVGYHLNALYSPLGWLSWAQIAAKYEKAIKDPEKMKVFVNTILGLPYKEDGEAPEWERLHERTEPYKLNKPPVEVCVITAGVDVQKDRLELEIVGWGKGRRSWSLDYRVLLGNTSERAVWDELAKVVSEQWEREDGFIIPLRMMAVDTGYNTQMVYDFCRRFLPHQVAAVKGSDTMQVPVTAPKTVDVKLDGKKVGRVRLWSLGVSVLKSELYGWLRLSKAEDGSRPANFCTFPQYEGSYFKGLTAEQLMLEKNSRGYTVYRWVKKVERNEPLDCRIYARAASIIAGIDRWEDHHYEAVMQQYLRATPRQASQPAQRERRRSSFWD